MKGFLAAVHTVGQGLVFIQPLSATDPGFGVPGGGVDPDYGIGTFPHPGQGLPGYGHPDQGLPGYGHPDQGLPGYGHPGNRPPGSWGGRPDNSLPVAPVRPSPPITLPPGVWPPQLPPGVDNTLPPPPPGQVAPPIYIPPGPDNELPIHIPSLPPGVAILIALPQAAPKEGTPPGTKPAILVQSGKKPVLVYVSAAATPK